jgi:hypothetical protein
MGSADENWTRRVREKSAGRDWRLILRGTRSIYHQRKNGVSRRKWILGFLLCAAAALPQLALHGQDAEIKRAAEAAGLQFFSSKHVSIVTDIRGNESVKEFPLVFDRAVEQWARFFEVPEKRLAKFHMTGYVMVDSSRFQQADFIPRDLPKFLHAYQLGDQFWIHEQPSDYYRRHLVLHEGTHGVMEFLFQGAGPPWYMEGTAELLGTHRWDGTQLEMSVIPDSKDAFAYLGRLKIIRQGQDSHQIPPMVEIMQYDKKAHLRVEPYAWCWALSVFLDQETVARKSFRGMAPKGVDSSPAFSSQFFRQHSKRWRQLETQWQAFAAEMEYGFSPAESVPTMVDSAPIAGEGRWSVNANHGWQSTGIQLKAAKSYRLTATGRYQVAQLPQPWWCEPQGITIAYHRGRPLGEVTAAVVSEGGVGEGESATADSAGSFTRPLPVGREAIIRPTRDGTLFLRINEAAGELGDNRGTASVVVIAQ